MFHHDPAHTGNLATPGLPCVAGPAAQPPTGPVSRLAGADRDATAVAVSRASFPQGGSAKAAVLASDANYPDALAGTPLAVSKAGPLLLTAPSGLNPTVSAELSRAVAPGATVYLLGGAAALSPGIEAQLHALGYQTQRLAGANRFATAVAIAGALGDPLTVLEATGYGFPDALSAGAAAAKSGSAVLLTAAGTQASETAAYLNAHPLDRRSAIGGPAASADPGATPISGPDRYSTAVLVAQKFFTSPPSVGFASGVTFPDALAGGANIGMKHGPMLLVPRCGPVPSAVTSYLGSVKSSLSGGGFLYGGPNAVGDDVLVGVDQAA
jgi:hypothetical protein